MRVADRLLNRAFFPARLCQTCADQGAIKAAVTHDGRVDQASTPCPVCKGSGKHEQALTIKAAG